MAAIDILKEIAPEYAGEDPARLNTFITLAENQISQNIFNVDYDLAVAYLAAHMLALSSRNTIGNDSGGDGLAGNITAKKEGDLSLNYALPAALSTKDGALATTSYGIEFMRLRDMHVICPRTFYGTS